MAVSGLPQRLSLVGHGSEMKPTAESSFNAYNNENVLLSIQLLADSFFRCVATGPQRSRSRRIQQRDSVGPGGPCFRSPIPGIFPPVKYNDHYLVGRAPL